MARIEIDDQVKCIAPGMSYDGKIGTVVSYVRKGIYSVSLGKMEDGNVKIVEICDDQLEFVRRKCVCEKEGWEEGDTLYFMNSWEHGYDFYEINSIKFCPVCGRKLPEEE